MSTTIIIDGGAGPLYENTNKPIRWTLRNVHDGDSFSHDGKKYQYGISMDVYHNHLNEVRSIRQWISEQNIEAIEARDSYTWYFKNESDRTILLLTWST